MVMQAGQSLALVNSLYRISQPQEYPCPCLCKILRYILQAFTIITHLKLTDAKDERAAEMFYTTRYVRQVSHFDLPRARTSVIPFCAQSSDVSKACKGDSEDTITAGLRPTSKDRERSRKLSSPSEGKSADLKGNRSYIGKNGLQYLILMKY